MQKNIALITGANSGMGLATTIELAIKGYHIVMACRNAERGERALKQAQQQSGSDAIELMICDLGSLNSIRSFAAEFNEKFDMLDRLILNAGVVSVKRETTSHGFESMIGVNHLGHFLLTNLLLDSLKSAGQGRIIVLSSGAHKAGHIDFQDPYLLKGFNVWKGYAQSKLANVLFTKELADRLQGSTVTINAVHPGAVSTSLGVSRKTGFGKSVHAALRPFFQSPRQGAETAIYLATSPEVQHVSGEYFYKKMVTPVSSKANNKEFAEKLWEWSEREIGQNVPLNGDVLRG